MYGKPWNPNRHFSEVHGIAPYAFHQDGQRYNAQKQPVDEHGKLMPLMPKHEAVDSVPVTPAPQPVNPDDDIPEDEKPLDLLAWANGDKELAGTPWQTVRNAATDVLGDISELRSKDALRTAILGHFKNA